MWPRPLPNTLFKLFPSLCPLLRKQPSRRSFRIVSFFLILYFVHKIAREVRKCRKIDAAARQLNQTSRSLFGSPSADANTPGVGSSNAESPSYQVRQYHRAWICSKDMTGVKKSKPKFEITNQRRDPSAEGVATKDIEGEIPSGTSGSIAARETVAVDIHGAGPRHRSPTPRRSFRVKPAGHVWRTMWRCSWDV
jgi:hypothetical protein